MTLREGILTVFAVLGGLALFIFGMQIMTEGLRKAAGAKLQTLLSRATRTKLGGLGLGTGMGTLVHSSATTVMLVGFVNAGLMSLEQTVPPMLGANVGTSLSMQAISFKLADYAWVAIAVGFIIQMAAPHRRTKLFGQALLGFGMLFLGMETMSAAIKPHRELLAPLLANIDGHTLKDLLIGIAISASLTAIWQSSGATIAIIFALISAGVFTRFEQVYPIVLGAHIGTCATALLGSIGTNIEARRSAFSHLIFNLSNVTFAVIARPFFFYVVQASSSDLTHQTANMHTIVMVISAFAVLPFSNFHARVVRFVVRSKSKPPQPSYLDPAFQLYPEKALQAAIRELQRIAELCAESFHSSANVLLMDVNRKTVQHIRLNEKIVNEIKSAMHDYLASLTSHYLSRRQTILLQHINRCMVDIERIGDHIDELCDLSLARKRSPEAIFDKESLEWLFAIYESADKVLGLVIRSLDASQKDFQSTAEAILQARDSYVEKSIDSKSLFTNKILEHQVSPLAAMYFMEYVASFDRIVRHSKTIALAQQHPDFWIKRRKLERKAGEPREVPQPELVDRQDFLDRLQHEDYL